jgi:NDP-sugar pyrophosphorylase family protein
MKSLIIGVIFPNLKKRSEKCKINLVRGKNLIFWIEEVFTSVEFVEKSELGPNPIPIIVFNPEAFLKMETRDFENCIRQILSRARLGNEIFTLKKEPFFILSQSVFKEMMLKSDIDPIHELKNHSNLRVFDPDFDYTVYEFFQDIVEIERVIIKHQLGKYFQNGVIVEDFHNFYIEGMIPIGRGSKISCGTVIKGETIIGENVEIFPNCFIENSRISDNCTLLPGCIVRDSKLEKDVQIGPYTHLRMGCQVRKGAKMGNFVEMKKSVLGEGSKSMHLSYIGDAEVGKGVNIGAGTITCNYDGVKKNKSIIEDGAFIGSGTELIAPIIVRKNSYVAAGSTINEEVPPDSLAVARQKQRIILDWVKRKRKKN